MSVLCKKKRNARNRKVVHADHRLYSPAYDWEGDDGLAQSSFEFFDSDAMCFFGICGPWSYNAWAKSTDEYIHGVLEAQYKKKVLPGLDSLFQGAPVPQDLQDTMNKVDDLIRSWDDAGYKPDKTQLDKFAHPTTMWWSGQIRGIIDYFDRAACMVDVLDAITIDVIKRPGMAIGQPDRVLRPSPTVSGSYLDGSGGPGSSNDGGNTSFAGKAVGIMAIGAAGYFGFKVLTE